MKPHQCNKFIKKIIHLSTAEEHGKFYSMLASLNNLTHLINSSLDQHKADQIGGLEGIRVINVFG